MRLSEGFLNCVVTRVRFPPREGLVVLGVINNVCFALAALMSQLRGIHPIAVTAQEEAAEDSTPHITLALKHLQTVQTIDAQLPDGTGNLDLFVKLLAEVPMYTIYIYTCYCYNFNHIPIVLGSRRNRNIAFSHSIRVNA